MVQSPQYEHAIYKSRQQPSNVAAMFDSPDEVTENVYRDLALDATRRDSIEMRSLGTSSTKCSKRACSIATVVILILVSLAEGGYGVFFFLYKEKGSAIVCPYTGENYTASISFSRPSITDFDDEVSFTYMLQTGDVMAIFPFTISIHTLHNMEEGVNVITAIGSDGVKTASCDFTYVRLPVNENSVSAAWSTWGSWDTCTETCCGGQQSRTRSCLSGEGESDDCTGSHRELQFCNTNQCPVWSAWGLWGSCSQTSCGGQQSRMRSCSSCGSPSNECRGSSSDTQACNTQHCPDGNQSGNQSGNQLGNRCYSCLDQRINKTDSNGDGCNNDHFDVPCPRKCLKGVVVIDNTTVYSDRGCATHYLTSTSIEEQCKNTCESHKADNYTSCDFCCNDDLHDLCDSAGSVAINTAVILSVTAVSGLLVMIF